MAGFLAPLSAEAPPGADVLRAQRLERQYRHLLAEASRLPAAERHQHFASLTRSRQEWEMALEMAGLPEPEKASPEMPPAVAATARWTLPDESPTLRQLQLPELPAQKHWTPRWGLSQRERREAQPPASTTALPETFTLAPEPVPPGRVDGRLPRQPYVQTEEAAVLLLSGWLKTRSFELIPPPSFLNTEWVLWGRNTPEESWQRTFSKGRSRETVQRSVFIDGPAEFVFVPVGNHPNAQTRPNASFVVDTAVPRIEDLKTHVEGERFEIVWETADTNFSEKPVSLLAYGDERQLLFSISALPPKSGYIVPREISPSEVAEVHLYVEDLAGHAESKLLRR